MGTDMNIREVIKAVNQMQADGVAAIGDPP
jgi:hypothetical protein